MYKNRLAEIDKLKQQIDTYRPFSTHIIQQLKEYFRIGLTYTSNAIEGNSLTETETKIILEDGLTIGGKTLREHLEVKGHSDAYDFMNKLATAKTISEEDIKHIHHLFYLSIDESNAGIYRKVRIMVSGTDYVFPMPNQVPKLMHQFAAQLKDFSTSEHRVTTAALTHLQFVTIHPFIDGNGRTARLLMNLVLLQHGYAITIIPPIRRHDYMSTLKKANNGDAQPFLDFIAEMVYESHKDYLRLLNNLT